MKASKTPIYDAVTDLVSDVLTLSSEISDALQKHEIASAEEREQKLRRLIVDNAHKNAAAQYLEIKLHLRQMSDGERMAFASRRQELVHYERCGKKQTISNLMLRGVPSGVGGHTEVTAMADGVITDVGKCYDPNDREYRRHLHITLRCEDGIDVRYDRMGAVSVEKGERVHAGQIIGKANSDNGCVVIDVRKLGRRINAADWCKIEVEEA